MSPGCQLPGAGCMYGVRPHRKAAARVAGTAVIVDTYYEGKGMLALRVLRRRLCSGAADKAGAAASATRAPRTEVETEALLRPVGKRKGVYGVLKKDKAQDIAHMVESFTAPALAAAVRDREQTLQICARLMEEEQYAELRKVLGPYKAANVARRRRRKRTFDMAGGLNKHNLNVIRKYLHRMPRHFMHASSLRAAVVMPLCNDLNGQPAVLFELRSSSMRTHSNQVCFPGGMVDSAVDSIIEETCLREMSEEIGIARDEVDVLGVLRCDWSDVTSITGVGVTPVVGFVGDVDALNMNPNPDEVQECFTIPFKDLLRRDKWVFRDFSAPIFTGGKHVVFGLTAFLLNRFIQDIFLKCRFENSPHDHTTWRSEDRGGPESASEFNDEAPPATGEEQQLTSLPIPPNEMHS